MAVGSRQNTGMSIQLQLLLATCAGWVNREQAAAIEFLVEENRVRAGKDKMSADSDTPSREAPHLAMR